MNSAKHNQIPEHFIKEAELLARGAEVLPGGVMELAKKLYNSSEKNRPLRVKLGLDPTRPDLHLGHTVVMRKLRQFQALGHQVVLIIGGATAMIGDPSGKSETRPALTKEEVVENAKTYLDQMGKVIDLSKAEVVNNADWLHKMQLADLLKLSSNVTVAQMLVRDDFSKRYSEGKPISVHEFFYPLMQAYDSVEVDADIELGGTDQRFNVLLGRDIQQAYGKKDPQMVILLPLLEGTDGVLKMSKSYPEHCISLTDPPNEIYGKIMSIPDTLIIRYFELLTDLPMEEIENHRGQLKSDYINPRDYKMKLAKTIIFEYYSREAAFKAEEEFINIFRKKGAPEEMPEYNVEEGKGLVDFIAEKGLVSSKSEAKRLIIGGGVKLDSEKICNIDYKIIFNDKDYIILQAGKRKFAKLIK
ncbi:MAG TPA: tyrosine--tRNA ligase [Candidatus Gastranaerophilales bacterium]|nr:tyrosine--tRNA ligase [Candidatus Gastranaerophilales bacterium]